MTEKTVIPHQLTSHTKLLHKVAIVWQHKILLLKRSSSALSRPDCWDLPGGNSEWPVAIEAPTENLHQGDIAREIVEETGLQVSPEVFNTNSLVLFYSFFDPAVQIFSIICGWHCPINKIVSSLAVTEQPVVVLSSEHQAFTWATPEELTTYDFGGDKGKFVLQIAQNALHRSTT